MAHKDKFFSTFSKFYTKILNEKNTIIVCIHSEHGIEFKNQNFENFCNENIIQHNFFAPRIPQQNDVIERKNKTLVDMAYTILCEENLAKYFWTKAINIAYYILNRVSI